MAEYAVHTFPLPRPDEATNHSLLQFLGQNAFELWCDDSDTYRTTPLARPELFVFNGKYGDPYIGFLVTAPKRRSFHVQINCRNHPPHRVQQLIAAGYAVHILDDPPEDP